jgi:NitT/TauT family transport system substrate-binding protein
MEKKGIVVLVATSVITLVAFGFLLLRKPPAPEKVEKVRIGLLPDSVSSLLVRLDQDLLTLMEDEGRWAIRNKLVDAEKIPDYSTFLHLEELRKIKPEAVGVAY